MKLSTINEGLGITANIGVVVSIIFLAIELNQANLIAIGDAERELGYRNIEITNTIINNPHLASVVLKLRERNPDFTEEENLLAYVWTVQLINLWNASDLAYKNNQITEDVYEGMMANIRGNLITNPGLAPYLYNGAQGETQPRLVRRIQQEVIALGLLEQ